MIFIDKISNHLGYSLQLRLNNKHLCIDIYDENDQISNGFYFNAKDTTEIVKKLKKELLNEI